MTNPAQLTFKTTDNDFYRVYFTDNADTLYCFQKEKSGFELFECTDEGEPLFPVDIELVDAPFIEGEDSTIPIARDYNEWLESMTMDVEVNPNLGY